MSSSDLAVRVEGLSKFYRIGAKQEKYRTMRDTIAGAFSRTALRSDATQRGGAERSNVRHTIWALKDVTFEVKRGEVVGVIGRNGAGKSTLLKILSRITEPTLGRAEIHGRIGSLLEVGTGFHPELSGRENIYLNGAILGMRRAEIQRRFDAIVEFAEVEKFIDTPVKHYSSGMYLRLAFAVAAHLEPEILLVDEVLAVGDAQFQMKCLGKMGEVASEGRTVLFVSHNMAAIQQLCGRCLLVADGSILEEGDPSIVIDRYVNVAHEDASAIIDTRHVSTRSGTGEGRITQLTIVDEFNNPSRSISIGKPFSVQLELELPSGSPGVVVGIELRRADGLPVLNLRSDSQGVAFDVPEVQSKPVTKQVRVSVPGLPLYPGRYLLEPWFCWREGQRVDHVHQVASITLVSKGVFSSERLLQPGRGIVLVDCEWAEVSA